MVRFGSVGFFGFGQSKPTEIIGNQSVSMVFRFPSFLVGFRLSTWGYRFFQNSKSTSQSQKENNNSIENNNSTSQSQIHKK